MWAYVDEEGHVTEIDREWLDSQGVQHPRNVLERWTEAELNARGVYRVTETSIPATSYQTGYDLVWDSVAKTVTRVWRLSNYTTAELRSMVREEARQRLDDVSMWFTVDAADHVSNFAEFVAYRLALMQIFVHRPLPPNWPTLPSPVWTVPAP